MDLGNQLKKLRKEYQLSQERLAAKLNVSRQAIYRWENNKGYPDIENLMELSDLFGVTIDEIIRSNEKLKKKINIDEDVHAYSDPGFFIGIIIVFIGILTNFGTLSTILMFSGLGIIVFYQDVLKMIKQTMQDFKRPSKDSP